MPHEQRAGKAVLQGAAGVGHGNSNGIGQRTGGGDSVTRFSWFSQEALVALRAFGAQAERLEYPYIDVGGFIVPGRDPALTNPPGVEHDYDASGAGQQRWGQAPREEARSSAGSRQRPPSPQAAPGAPPHTVERRLTGLNLNVPALVAFHPLSRIVASTETAVYINLPIGVIPEVSIRARLTLEVPLVPRSILRQSMFRAGVPDVRAWAVWEGGPMHGRRIASHHQNPDSAICANMPGQWILGVHPLHDYIAFCVLWVAKTLHELAFDFYPGLQHYPAAVRVQRDRPDEFCGCGKQLRYRDCCRLADLSHSQYTRWSEAQLARTMYLSELARQGRQPTPPAHLMRLGLKLP